MVAGVSHGVDNEWILNGWLGLWLSFELMFPGVFMLWFGVSGLLTAGIVYVAGFSGLPAIIIFLCLGVVASIFGSRFQNKDPKFLVNNEISSN